VGYVFNSDHPHGAPPSVIGGKATNLAVMAHELGLPVPPWFVISTAACRAYLDTGWPPGLDTEIERGLAAIAAEVGRGFGDPGNPLLLGVRSGAPVSMPGMMDTILNLGLNDETARGLVRSTGDAAFVHSCRRRLVETYREIVETAVPDDPWLQLRRAIEAVFDSWNSKRARSYRAREGISEDLCTGVIVQAMVFGNRGDDSATGVLFTRNPATGEAAMCGDVMFNAQGEDVVAGTHNTEPLSVLDERMPSIGAQLRASAEQLERHYADVCDVEFTIEQGTLWILQTRIGKRSPQAALRIAAEMAEDPNFPLTKQEAVNRVAGYLASSQLVSVERDRNVRAVATGLGVSPGVVSGEIATTPEDAVRMADAGKDVVLVRRNTSPNDVPAMARAAGILTATGGLVSHAAVVARGWGIPAVVGAAGVTVEGETVDIGAERFGRGDVLTIDGTTGDVFAGAVSTTTQAVPEAAKLLAWAQDLGIAYATEVETSESPAAAAPISGASRPDVIHALLVKGLAGAAALAEILFTSPDALDPELDRLVAEGLVGTFGGEGALAAMFQLTEDGKSVGARRIATDRQHWGRENAVRALDDLLPLDLRMKEILTGWQLRDVDGQQVVNDHADAAHDAAVLDGFRRLHQDASAWLRSLVDGLPRLRLYLTRLDRAAQAVDAGDFDYLASPRLDSYHSVWFELHEDLILLAGRTREEEVAAGRA
jgi:pyruvate,orthophosphate dikinase